MNNVYLFQVNYTVKIGGVDSLWLPYSVGCIQSYAKSKSDITDYYNFGPELFCRREDPAELIKRLDNPSVAGFSNYVWNTNWNIAMSKLIKETFPECLIMFGGPNVWDGMDEEHSHIDAFLTQEGEFGFLDLLRKHRDGEEIPKQLSGERIHNLEELTDPYATGEFNWLVKNYPTFRWNGTFETNRGCPFLCTFCDWGSLTFTKVKKFEIERVESNMKWMSENKVSYVVCADANVGIFKDRDIEIAKIARKYADAPGSLIDGMNFQYNKNNTDVCLDIAEILGPYSRGITFAVQSMTESVLEAIKRKNMAMNKLSTLIKEANKRNLMSYTELILPMPEETLDSWKDGFTKILNAGQHNLITVWNCQVLKNSEMNQPAYMEKYGIEKTSAMDYINYENENDWQGAPEEIEIIRATNTMPLEDTVEAWMFGIIIREFHINGVTQMLSRYCNGKHGLTYRKFYEELYNKLKQDDVIKDILKFVEFVEEHYLKTGDQPSLTDVTIDIPEIYGSEKGTLPPQHFMKDILNATVFNNLQHFRDIALDMVITDFGIELPQGVIDFNNGFTYNKDVEYPQTVTFDYNVIMDIDEETEYTFIPKILDESLDAKIVNKGDVMLFKSGLYKSSVLYKTLSETNTTDVHQYGTAHPTDVGHKDEKII
jgi:radical SAM superfamily enzyme YgiQ (UPF0313 family)|tara:strand:+ start:6780 stop:8744 length:1965 start_codon:yes stop_codon:yes gene_type:complete